MGAQSKNWQRRFEDLESKYYRPSRRFAHMKSIEPAAIGDPHIIFTKPACSLKSAKITLRAVPDTIGQ
jgi:hypothetical protein